MAILILLIISLVLGLVTYISTLSYVPSIAAAGISLIILLIFCNPLLTKYSVLTKRFHSCYRFMNNFIISLSIKKTISAAFESVLETMDDEFKKEFKEISHLTDIEKLDYLHKFYRFHIYNLFLNIVNVYMEQGGNILKMSNTLIEKSRTIEEYLNNCHTVGIRKITEFSVLWIFSIIILLVLRMVLGEFYASIASQPFYQIAVAALMVFISISITIILYRFTSMKVGGWDYEKA